MRRTLVGEIAGILDPNGDRHPSAHLRRSRFIILHRCYALNRATGTAQAVWDVSGVEEGPVGELWVLQFIKVFVGAGLLVPVVAV